MYLYDELANDRGYVFELEDTLHKYNVRIYSKNGDGGTGYLIISHVDAGYIHNVYDAVLRSKYNNSTPYHTILICVIPKPPSKKIVLPPNVQVIDQWRLCYNPTRHKWVPKHSLVNSMNELKHVLHGRDVSKLPKLLQDDPVSIWLGFQVGDIIKIERKHNVMFRVVL
jgi:DNA-directed RNA polymerase subunit H (RpoH/RPB5)